MSNNTPNVNPDEAKKALESVAQMEGAGWRRGVPDRWFGAGVSVLIGSLFALYALEDPSPYIPFPILGLAIFIAMARDNKGAYGRDFPATGKNIWAMLIFTVVLLIVFFGSIVVRRTYDAAWVSLLTGAGVAIFVYIASESERRAYLAKAVTLVDIE